MNIFLFLILLLNCVPLYAADYVDWQCTKKVQIVEKKEFIIFSDLTEATLQAKDLNGKLVGIKDADGNLAYMVVYISKVVESNLVDDNDCKQFYNTP